MPYRIDLFAVFIFLGIVQGIFLCIFFFSKENRQIQTNFFRGLVLLSMTFCIVEIFLMYTGYIIDVLHLIDFSEPFALLIGPCFYFMVLSLTRGTVPKRYYWHLLFPAIYTLMLIPFFLQPADVKYNCWIDSYDIALPARGGYHNHDPRIFWLTDFQTELVVLSLLVYGGFCLWEIAKVFKMKKESFLKPVNPALKKLSVDIRQFIGITLLIILIKILNPRDTGDHIFAAYIAFSIYLTSFNVIRQSGFFKSAPINEPQKYKTSSLTEDQQQLLLKRLQLLMMSDKPYLRSDFSLPDLAQQLGSTVHTLSQVINNCLGKNFFEMTAEYRVEEAKRLLREQRNIKVEEIAEQVGYNSKSSFNTAFKKITGKTPSEFRAI
jgi:AraC-like DNA-binding protein